MTAKPPVAPTTIVKAFSLVRHEGGWSCVTFTLQRQGTAFTLRKTEMSNSNLFMIAKEEFKKNVAKWWSMQ